MKPLAFVALIAPFVLLAILLGTALTVAHRQAAIYVKPSATVSCAQPQSSCVSPAAQKITTLSAVTIHAGAAHTASAQDQRSAVTRWLAKLKVTTATHDSRVMPYYSFGKPDTATANKG